MRTPDCTIEVHNWNAQLCIYACLSCTQLLVEGAHCITNCWNRGCLMRTSYLTDPSRQNLGLVFQHGAHLALRMSILHLSPYQRHERYSRWQDIIRIATFNDALGVFFQQCQEHIVRQVFDRFGRDRRDRRLSRDRSVACRNRGYVGSGHRYIMVSPPNPDGRFEKIEFEITRPPTLYRARPLLPLRPCLGATQVDLARSNPFLKVVNKHNPSVSEHSAGSVMKVGVQRSLSVDRTPRIAKITWTLLTQFAFAEVPLRIKDGLQPALIAPAYKRVLQWQLGFVSCDIHESPSGKIISRITTVRFAEVSFSKIPQSVGCFS